MKTRFFVIAVLAASAFVAGEVQAGYWHTSSGEVWRNSSGECWRTGSWSPDKMIVGCDGKEAEVVAPEPVARPEPAPVPEPMAMPALDATVNFGFDRADVDAESAAALNSMLSQARAKGRIKGVKLVGHADRIGTEAYNLDLSLRRATAVSDFLTAQAGVDPQAIEIGGKGESMPVVACDGERGAALVRCLAPNRRVEMMLELF